MKQKCPIAELQIREGSTPAEVGGSSPSPVTERIEGFEMSKQENVQAIINRFTPEELSLIFRAATYTAKPQGAIADDPRLINEVRQENFQNKLSIASSELELAAHTG